MNQRGCNSLHFTASRNSSTRSKVARIANRLKWPLGKQDHLETIESLHRYIMIFDFALSVDGRYQYVI